MGNMNIHIENWAKYEYSYNLANLRENWAQKKKSLPGVLLGHLVLRTD